MPTEKLLAAKQALVTDPEFRALCTTPSADGSAQVERTLVAEGCRDNLSYLCGAQYLLEKQPRGGNHASTAEATYHCDNLPTAKRLADEFHVGFATIYRDGSFAASVSAIVATCGPEAKQVILARDSVVTRRKVFSRCLASTLSENPRTVPFRSANGRNGPPLTPTSRDFASSSTFSSQLSTTSA